MPDRFAAIDALKTELARQRKLAEEECLRLQQDFTVEFTYDSNAIEGSSLTLRETALVLDGITNGQKPLREHLQAFGHRDAYNYEAYAK